MTLCSSLAIAVTCARRRAARSRSAAVNGGSGPPCERPGMTVIDQAATIATSTSSAGTRTRIGIRIGARRLDPVLIVAQRPLDRRREGPPRLEHRVGETLALPAQVALEQEVEQQRVVPAHRGEHRRHGPVEEAAL